MTGIPSSDEEMEASQEAVQTLVKFRDELDELDGREMGQQHQERLRDLRRSVEGHLAVFARDIDVAADQLGKDLE